MRQSVSLAGLLVFLPCLVTPNSVYKAVGDKVVLTADPVAGPITAITWKHGPDIAMDWYKGSLNSYRQFKDRGMLNSSTGALTITGLTRSDSGIYTAEINQHEGASLTQLLVISPVSKPSVSTWCDPQKTYCVFTCKGNTTDAEPITYKWGGGDTFRESTNVHNITKEEKEPSFRCMLVNPVSSENSDPVVNPFTTRNRTWTLTCLIALVGVSVCVFLFIYKCRKGKDVEGTPQERSVMLPGGQETPNQTTCDVHRESDSAAEVQEIPTEDSTSPVSPDISSEAESLSAISETSDQDPTNAATPHASNETENSALMSSGEEPSGCQEPPVDEQPQDEDQS
ncbi:uncharacterized protein LOC122872452 isoform X3 [Siniperca chuatsi]|uniref:uncharacterized protein LOC122872452 isoform X2 n=1 Tax=Siniperca chuatsi TaxID=119488 RepID=UPI001CE1EE39|nr:uncharacterized protein LOC122872452 isoform X2 [Siniperca chuatsi]XP_044044656.1 uncharacterized protein LOC122872452 isoform X3 [Siniperca chuatsi]